jgi:hypothetical protein
LIAHFHDHKVKKFAESVQDAYRKRKTEMMQYSGILNEIKQKTVKSAGDWQENDSISGDWRKLSVKKRRV